MGNNGPWRSQGTTSRRHEPQGMTGSFVRRLALAFISLAVTGCGLQGPSTGVPAMLQQTQRSSAATSSSMIYVTNPATQYPGAGSILGFSADASGSRNWHSPANRRYGTTLKIVPSTRAFSSRPLSSSKRRFRTAAFSGPPASCRKTGRSVLSNLAWSRRSRVVVGNSWRTGRGSLPWLCRCRRLPVDRVRTAIVTDNAIVPIASATVGNRMFFSYLLKSVVLRPHSATPKVMPLGMPMPLALS